MQNVSVLAGVHLGFNMDASLNDSNYLGICHTTIRKVISLQNRTSLMKMKVLDLNLSNTKDEATIREILDFLGTSDLGRLTVVSKSYKQLVSKIVLTMTTRFVKKFGLFRRKCGSKGEKVSYLRNGKEQFLEQHKF